jgi:hypothetical protein
MRRENRRIDTVIVKVDVEIQRASPVSGDGVRNLTMKILDGISF